MDGCFPHCHNQDLIHSETDCHVI